MENKIRRLLFNIPLSTWTRSYYYTRYTTHHVFEIPIDLYGVKEVPFKSNDLLKLELRENRIIMSFKDTPGDKLKDYSIKDLE